MEKIKTKEYAINDGWLDTKPHIDLRQIIKVQNKL